jgi:hypothetical protein
MNGPLSLIPQSLKTEAVKAVARDAGSKHTLSMVTIVALVYGAYQLGARQSAEIGDIKLAITKLTTIVEKIGEGQVEMKQDNREMRRDISVIEGRTNGIRGEMDNINKKLDD